MKLKVARAKKDDVLGDVIRVDFQHRPHTKAGDLIKVWADDRFVIGIARGIESSSKNSISLDDALRTKLCVECDNEYEFCIEPSNIMDELMWALNSIDATLRLAARLAVLSLALGVMGLALGLVSLAISLGWRVG